jgi:hypothetical protein
MGGMRVRRRRLGASRGHLIERRIGHADLLRELAHRNLVVTGDAGHQ